MNCERHPDREGALRIDLPSIGLKRFLCDECNERLKEVLRGIVSNDRQPWEKALATGAPEKDALYAYRERTRDGHVGQVNWRHPYERK